MQQQNLETFGYGVKRYTIEQDRIIVIETEGNMSRAAIDTWADLTIQTLQQEDDGTPLLLLQNLSNKNQGFTPYTRKRTDDVLHNYPHRRQTRVATVLPDTFIVRLVKGVLRQRGWKATHIQERIFTSYPQALDWLRSF